MNSKHLSTGSAFPALQEGKLRFYNNRWCPYGQRILLVTQAKGIPVDIVNCDLKRKPEWLIERNPAGKVPTIETPKGPLYESLIVTDYLEEVYPGRTLKSADPFQRAWDRVLIENFSSVSTIFHKVLFAKCDLELVKGSLVELTQALAPFEAELKKRGTNFFGGNDNPGMLDYMIWPWFERLPILEISYPKLYDFEAAELQRPLLRKWEKAMRSDKAIDAAFISAANHHKFALQFLTGTQDLDYDNFDWTAK